MDLKFYLNKFCKADNIECYYLDALINLRDTYENYLKNTDGLDPDFPGINFGGKGETININGDGNSGKENASESGISILDL